MKKHRFYSKSNFVNISFRKVIMKKSHKQGTVYLAEVGTKKSAPLDFYYGRVITGVEIYHTQFLTPINFKARPGRIITGNT